MDRLRGGCRARAKRGTIASRNGSASVAPIPRRTGPPRQRFRALIKLISVWTCRPASETPGLLHDPEDDATTSGSRSAAASRTICRTAG